MALNSKKVKEPIATGSNRYLIISNFGIIVFLVCGFYFYNFVQ